MALTALALERDATFKPTVSGIIGISTAFDVGHNVPRWQLGLVNIIAPLSRFLFFRSPRLSRLITIREMNISLISPDISVQKSIQSDELVYKGRIPLNTSAQVYQAGQAAKGVIDQLGFPVLLLHSEDDSIAIAPQPGQFGAHVKLRLFRKLRVYPVKRWLPVKQLLNSLSINFNRVNSFYLRNLIDNKRYDTNSG